MEVPGLNIDIEVVYALPEKQIVRQMNLPEGTTVEQAVELSGILPQFPEIDLLKNRLGIHGRLVPPTKVLCNRDRVEIYRPLRIDPKENRRKRAKAGDCAPIPERK